MLRFCISIVSARFRYSAASSGGSIMPAAAVRSTDSSAGYPAFLHGHPVQPVHPRHGQGMVSDDQELGAGVPDHVVQQGAEPLHVGVVKRGVDLVQYANRRWIAAEHGEDQRQCRQRLLAARQQRQRREFLARRLRVDLQSGLQRVVGADQGQCARPPPNMRVNNCWKLRSTSWNTAVSRSRPSRFRCPIEPRSLAMAVVSSSRSDLDRRRSAVRRLRPPVPLAG